MPGSQLVQLNPVLVKVGGQDLDSKWYQRLELVEVDMTLGAPNMVALHFSDPELSLVDDATFQHGSELEVSAPVIGPPVSVAKVEVASLEPDFRGDGSDRYVVRGYDKWNRLQNGRKSKTYLAMKDSDIASSIAGAAGLSAQVTATSETYEYLVQWQQTDMEFLLERAERIGYEVYQDGANLVFKPQPSSTSTSFEFKYGVNLARFQPRFSIAGQLSKATVHGWDRSAKRAISGEASPAGTQGGMGRTGGAAATEVVGEVTEHVTDGSVTSAADAQSVAKAIVSRVNGEFFEADGECEGAPGLRPGMWIKIANVGTRFSGNYRVTGVHHSWSSSGMSTQFTVLGRNGATLAAAMLPPVSRRRIDGLMIGVVTNVNDADGPGRVKVKFPTLGVASGAEIESAWARVAAPFAGAQLGMMFFPEINEEVLVGFEDGDPAHPVVVGSLWNGTDKPPLSASELQASGKINQRIIKTKVGHIILIDDTSGSEKIKITDKSGAFFLMDSANKLMHMKDTAGNEVKLDGQGRSVLVKSAGEMTLEATQALNIKGMSVSIKSTGGALEVNSATTLAISATASAEIKANAMMTVKTSAILTIQGSLVKIN